MSVEGKNADGVARFTTEYSRTEDRIRLSIELNDGRVRVLWLTRLLATRIVEQLVKIAEAIASKASFGSVSEPVERQRMSQQAAQSEMTRQSPVRADDGAEAQNHLITAVSVRLQSGALYLDFKVDDTVVQAMPFSESALRQWIGLLYKNFSYGNWSEDIWPKWITAPANTSSAERLN